jgi:DNA-binding CsgD family transcriptional regulator
VPKPLRLARREREILRLAVDGLAPKEIAGRIEIAQATVNNRFLGIARKLEVTGRQAVIMWALQNPAAIKLDVRDCPPITPGLHPATCGCPSPYCQAQRIIAA